MEELHGGVVLLEQPTSPETQATVFAEDGEHLAYRLWEPELDEARAVVVALHCIGMHGEPYRMLADSLCPLGFAVCAPDVRGHGLSGGDRGGLVSERMLRLDLSAVLDDLRDRFGNAPVFLVGDSMGALIALSYVRSHPHEVAGVALLGLPLELRARQVLCRESLDAVRQALEEPSEAVDLVGRRLDDCSADEAFKAWRREDPLSLRRVSTDYLLVLGSMAAHWRARYAPVSVPTLLVHGEADGFASPAGSRLLHRALAAEDKQLAALPGAHHTLLWDEHTPEVLTVLGDWLERHAPRP